MKLFQIVSEKMRYPNFDNAISEQILTPDKYLTTPFQDLAG